MLHNTIGRLGERAAAIGLICASIVALASTYAFQFLGGLQPCALCLYQRIPWWVALGLGALSLRLYATVWMRNLMVWSGAAAVLAGAGIAGYHAGVEYKWWAGPATCKRHRRSRANTGRASRSNHERGGWCGATKFHGPCLGFPWRGTIFCSPCSLG